MSKKKRNLWPWIYSLVLIGFTTYVLLDTFVIQHVYSVVRDDGEMRTPAAEAVGWISEPTAEPVAEPAAEPTAEPTDNRIDAPEAEHTAEPAVIAENSYKDENISINITQYREYDTEIYVADITVSSADYLKTAFANNLYGRNITQAASEMAEEHNAVLAVNGDYYGARTGYVIRNGVLYRDVAAAAKGQQDLVIYEDGTFEVVEESAATAQELLDGGARQVFSFGPGLIIDGEVAVDKNTEVDKSQKSNPRTAIGIMDSLHYVMVVCDGRTSQSEGLSLYELAQFMQKLGVETAYNLDGGGSSTMVFNGEVINNPTSNGKRIAERKVSDIVYIG